MVARALAVGLLALAGACAGAADERTVPVAARRPVSCPPGRWPAGGTCVPPEAALAPNGRLFVVDAAHPAADDAGPGSAARPWRTIGRAALAMQAGDAVLIHAGVYRESVAPPRGGTDVAHRITYAAAPGARVVVSGADPAPDGWQPAGDGRWTRDWPGPSLPAYSDDPVFRREQVWVAGRPLRHVGSVAEVGPGTMHVAGTGAAPARMTISLPPGATLAEAEVSVRERLFWPAAREPRAPCGAPRQPSWIRVVGLRFVHAANRAQWGAVCAGFGHGLWEDVEVAWSVGLGVDASGRDHTFRRVESRDHGQMGWGARCQRCLFEDTASRRNNWRGHDPFWEAGGGKWVHTTDTVLRRHTAEDNGGPGVWFDGDNARNTIEDARIVGNEGAGVMLELRTVEMLVQHSVIRDTRWRDWTGSGILSQAASRNLILHNTIEDNDGTGLWLRLDPQRRAPDGGTRVEANRIAGNARRATEAREASVEAVSRAALAGYTFRGNAYGRPSGDPVLRSTFFVALADGEGEYRGSDRARWAAWTGEDDARWDAGRSLRARTSGPLPSVGAPSAPPRRGPFIGARR